MAERRVSVRLAAVGGKVLKAELTEIGKEGQRALEGIAVDGQSASAALDYVAASTSAALRQMEQLAARSAQAAATLRSAGTGTSAVASRIDAMTGVSTGPSAADVLAQGRALDDLRAKYNPLFATIRGYKQELAEIKRAHLEGAISADEMTAAISRERQAALAGIAVLKGRTVALGQMCRSSGMAAMQSRQLLYQLNDIGVSLAGGMPLMMVAAQQGTQIAQIYGGQGGAAAALRDTGRMAASAVTRFPPLTAAIVVAGVAVAGLRHEINETSDVAVGFGDVMKAVIEIPAEWIGQKLAPEIKLIGALFSRTWDLVLRVTKVALNAIVKGWQLTFATIGALLDGIPALFAGAFQRAKAEVLYVLADMAMAVGSFLRSTATMLNETFGTAFGTGAAAGLVDEASTSLNKMANDAMVASDQAWTAAGDSASNYAARVQEIIASDPMGTLFQNIRDEAIENAGMTGEALKEAGGAAGGGLKAAGEEAAKLVEKVDPALDAIRQRLADYASEAQDWGSSLGDSIVSAFQSAEDAVAEFVTTGKIKIEDLVKSVIADMARLATRSFVTGPLAQALLTALGGATAGAGGQVRSLNTFLPSYQGGGWTGGGGRSGGLDGRGGYLAMLHPRETVIDHVRDPRSYGGQGVVININAADAESFRRSRTQVASDIARAVAYGRRGM